MTLELVLLNFFFEAREAFTAQSHSGEVVHVIRNGPRVPFFQIPMMDLDHRPSTSGQLMLSLLIW